MELLAQEKRLSIKRKCELLHLNRSSLYYNKQLANNRDIELMSEIYNIYIKYPFFGYRKVNAVLISKGYKINRKRVQRLMRLAGLRAVYPKKKTSLRDKNHTIYPYLLSNIKISYPNQVWQIDITYIKMKSGFVYLICLIDVYSRKIMGWNLSVFLDTDSCLEALQSALLCAKPEIINSDQGCQFTSGNWCNMLVENAIKISMDGKGRWADNIYIERLWRTIKYEFVYLHRFETISDLRAAIANYILFYNKIRPHQSLEYRVPNEVYKEFDYANNVNHGDWIVPSILGVKNNSEIFAQKLS